MSSLWTPGGEVPVSRTPASTPSQQPEARSSAVPAGARDEAPDEAMLGGINLDDLTPEERAQAEEMLAEMAETQRRLAAMPATEVIANHAMGLYELAAIHLSQPTPQFDDAKVAIDAMTAVVEVVGSRFGENLPPLREALRNLQMTFVRLRDQFEGPPPQTPPGG